MLAGAGALAGLAMAVLSLLAGGRPWPGVPPWTWLSLALACLLIREAQLAFRMDRPPR